MPRVSVVMPVFNVERYVGEAVSSVLAQTFRDLELIVVDDGSSDGTADAVEHLGDPRVRLIRAAHEGYVPATRRGLELATGELIARADGDDVYDPTLFERQIEMLDGYPRTAAVGAWARQFGGEQQWYPTPTDPEGIRIFLRRGCALVQPVMMRASVYREVGGLRAVAWEDWDLWIRMATRYELRNIPEILVSIRYRADSVFRSPRRLARRRANLRARLTAARHLGVGMHSGLILARNLASVPVYEVLDRVAPPKPRPRVAAPPDPTVTVVVTSPAGAAPDAVEATVAALRELHPVPDEIVALGANDDPAARARAAASDVVAFVAAGEIPRPGWIAEIRHELVDPTVGALGGPVQGAADAPRPIRSTGRESGPVAPGSRYYGDVEALPPNNVAVRRELIGSEGLDVTSPVRRSGLRLLYSPWLAVDAQPAMARAKR
jgi:hypothetical protein